MVYRKVFITSVRPDGCQRSFRLLHVYNWSSPKVQKLLLTTRLVTKSFEWICMKQRSKFQYFIPEMFFHIHPHTRHCRIRCIIIMYQRNLCVRYNVFATWQTMFFAHLLCLHVTPEVMKSARDSTCFFFHFLVPWVHCKKLCEIHQTFLNLYKFLKLLYKVDVVIEKFR